MESAEAEANSDAVQATHFCKGDMVATGAWVVGDPEGQGLRLRDCGPGSCSISSSSNVVLSPNLTLPYLPNELPLSFQKPAFSRKSFLSSSMLVLALHLDHIFRAASVTQCCDYSLKARILQSSKELLRVQILFFFFLPCIIRA